AWMGSWRAGRGTPIMALLAQALITAGLLFLLGTRQGHEATNEALKWIGVQETTWKARSAFSTLVDHTAPVFWFFFLLTGLSLFALRERDAHLPRTFSVPFYPVVPLLFCTTCVYMLYRALDYVKDRALLAFAVLWVGVFVYLLARLVGMRTR